jgi:hypothetical protein
MYRDQVAAEDRAADAADHQRDMQHAFVVFLKRRNADEQLYPQVVYPARCAIGTLPFRKGDSDLGFKLSPRPEK